MCIFHLHAYKYRSIDVNLNVTGNGRMQGDRDKSIE